MDDVRNPNPFELEPFEHGRPISGTVTGQVPKGEIDAMSAIAEEPQEEEPREEAAQPVDDQPGTAPPVEESPAGEASEEFVCSGCGRTFRHAAGLGRHRQTCRSTHGQPAPAPQWARDMQAIPGAASAARQMAEEALAKIPEHAKARTTEWPALPAFDDTLAGWLEWLVNRWEAEDSEEERQNRYGELLALAVRQDLPLLRRLLERERARERAR